MGYCVFQYDAEFPAENVRRSLADLILQCIESKKRITQAEFKGRIPKLLYGNYPPKAEKDIEASLDALLWKYSELTGKYGGCQFWSDGAKRLFERKLLEHTNGRDPTSDDAQQVARVLQRKSQADDQRIVHEHVFPRAELRKKLLQTRDIFIASGCLPETLERLAIGCVVLGSEDRLLRNKERNYDNPWLRYKGKIKLSDNQKNWPPSHLKLIKDAELLSAATAGR